MFSAILGFRDFIVFLLVLHLSASTFLCLGFILGQALPTELQAWPSGVLGIHVAGHLHSQKKAGLLGSPSQALPYQRAQIDLVLVTFLFLNQSLRLRDSAFQLAISSIMYLSLKSLNAFTMT